MGANIVTMNEAQPSAEAVAEKGRQDSVVGSRAELEGNSGKRDEIEN